MKIEVGCDKLIRNSLPTNSQRTRSPIVNVKTARRRRLSGENSRSEPHGSPGSSGPRSSSPGRRSPTCWAQAWPRLLPQLVCTAPGSETPPFRSSKELKAARHERVVQRHHGFVSLVCPRWPRGVRTGGPNNRRRAAHQYLSIRVSSLPYRELPQGLRKACCCGSV